MPSGWSTTWITAAWSSTTPAPRIGRPDRGNRAKTKAARKAARRR